MNADFKVRIPSESSRYPIFLPADGWKGLGAFCRNNFNDYKFVIVHDSGIPAKYIQQVIKEIKAFFGMPEAICFRQGEKNKTQKTVFEIHDRLFKMNFGRKTVLLALGGGVTGDLAGFAAAIYKRGIPYIQLPTTLLSQVDSSVGGKTGVDNSFGKNMIGAFHNPAAVFINISTLDTLPQRHFLNGFAEIIKASIIADKKLFEYLEENHQGILEKETDALRFIIRGSIAVKKKIVERDPFEKGLRKILNFGHTTGHAIEQASGYKLLHGEAVSIGMMIETELLYQRNEISLQDYQRIEKVLRLYKIGIEKFTKLKLNDSILKSSILQDKKRHVEKIPVIAVKRIGKTSNKEKEHLIQAEPKEILESAKKFNSSL